MIRMCSMRDVQYMYVLPLVAAQQRQNHVWLNFVLKNSVSKTFRHKKNKVSLSR